MDTKQAVHVGPETELVGNVAPPPRQPPSAVQTELPEIPDLARRGLVAEVMKESIAQMKLVIGAVSAVVVLLASVLGISGYLKVNALDEQVTRADSLVTVMQGLIAQQKGKSDSLQLAVNSARDLYANVRDMGDRQFENYRGLLDAYQSTAQNASLAANAAAGVASDARRDALTASGEVKEWTDTMRTLRREVASADARVDARDQRFDALSTRVEDRVFGVWSTILDETGENGLFTPIGDSEFDARVIKIHRSSEVTLEIASRTSRASLLCGHRLRLHIGEQSPPCEMNGQYYEVLVPWAVKQGLSLVPVVGAHYPDRAAIQVKRVAGPPTPLGTRTGR